VVAFASDAPPTLTAKADRASRTPYRRAAWTGDSPSPFVSSALQTVSATSGIEKFESGVPSAQPATGRPSPVPSTLTTFDVLDCEPEPSLHERESVLDPSASASVVAPSDALATFESLCAV
jgi:hypothetical protein